MFQSPASLLTCVIVLVVAYFFHNIESNDNTVALVLGGFSDTLSFIPECFSGTNPWCDGDYGMHYFSALFRIIVDELGSSHTQTADQVAEHYISSLDASSKNPLNGKVAIITGASNGIGLEIARVFLKFGCRVVFAVRNVTKGEETYENIQSEMKGNDNIGTAYILHLDLSDLRSVERFVASFQALDIPLHYLINNAGIMALPEEKVSKQGYEMQFATNHLGHFYLIRLLEDSLLQSGTSDHPARVLCVTSTVSNLWNGPGKQGMKGLVPPTARPYQPLLNYALSKVLNILTAKELQRRWGPDVNAVAVAIHPGVVETSLVRDNSRLEAVFFIGLFFMLKSVEQAASTALYAALASEVVAQARAGHYYYRNNAVSKPRGWKLYTEELCREAWELSVELVDDS